MKDKTNVFSIVLNGLSYLASIEQTEQLFKIIQLVISIICSIILIIINVWKWWNNAKKDGKIDNDELDQLANIIKRDGDDNEQSGTNDKGSTEKTD